MRSQSVMNLYRRSITIAIAAETKGEKEKQISTGSKILLDAKLLKNDMIETRVLLSCFHHKLLKTKTSFLFLPLF